MQQASNAPTESPPLGGVGIGLTGLGGRAPLAAAGRGPAGSIHRRAPVYSVIDKQVALCCRRDHESTSQALGYPRPRRARGRRGVPAVHCGAGGVARKRPPTLTHSAARLG